VVTADGQFLRASAEENPDLYWGLRGGGGNFGVVTEFEFRAHHVDMVYGGPVFWPIEDLEAVMNWYRDWVARASENAYAFFLIATVPNGAPFPENARGRKVCGIVSCFLGGKAEVSGVLEEARQVATPLLELVGQMPFPSLQTMHDSLMPSGLYWYLKGAFVDNLSDAAIAVHKHFADTLPTPLSTMHLYPIDGAVHTVHTNATAWSARTAKSSMIIAGIDAQGSRIADVTAWVRAYWQALQPHTAAGSYVNFMMEEGSERVQATYGANYQCLRELKRKYDPKNLFHVNQNITPL